MYEVVFKKLAKVFKALAHPRRLEIMQLLGDQTLSVTDIYQMLDLPQANVSQHLAILKTAKLITSKRHGKELYYSISDASTLSAVDQIRDFLIQNEFSDRPAEFDFHISDLLPLTHDPVCQMRVSPKTAGGTTKYQDHQFFFCASGCLKTFLKNPERYL